MPWLALLLLLLVPGAAAGQNGGTRPEVEAIVFEGNEAFPDDSLRLAIVNRETECRTIFLKPFCWLDLGFADDRHYLNPRELPRDVVRLELYYWQRGYREADADTTIARQPGQNEIRITFHIDEGRPVLVDTILFTGDSVPPSSILRNLPLDEGDPLSGILLEATVDSIQGRLWNAGYAEAEVFRNFFIPSDSYEAEVEFDIYTGPLSRFGEIDVRWTHEDHSLDRESVLRFLPFETGDVYSREQILQAQRSLFGVELIQSARIVEDTLAEVPDSIFPLTVTITEGDVHRVGAGTGFTTADCFNGEARWTSRNFRGGARRLTVRGRLSNVLAESLHRVACPDAGEGEFGQLNWLASVELFQPWVFSTRNSLTASLYGERTSLNEVFVREAVGAQIGLSRSLGRRTPANVTYRPQLSRLQAAEFYFCTSFLVCEPSDIDVLLGANWLAPVGLSVSHDRTDDLLNPSNGYELRLDLEHASRLTGSNFRYHRAIAEASWYDEVARRTVIAARLRGGWIGGGEFVGEELDRTVEVVHPQKRFYAGGATSVRGFAQNRLGPRVLSTGVRELLGFVDEGGETRRVCTPEALVALTCDPSLLDDAAFQPRPTGGTRLLEGNLEYRFAYGGSLQGVVFLDFGQVWSESQSVDVSDVELSPGVGARYFSPVGPIRVDLAYRFRGGERLNVVTSQIRPFMEGDDARDRICVDPPADGLPLVGQDTCDGEFVPIQWVRVDELAVLKEPYLFGDQPGFLRSLQLHISIGQAF